MMPPFAQPLHEYGHRLTPQRYLILRVLNEATEHLCLEQIVQHVQMHNPQVNQSTVYRNLALLQEIGLIRQVHFAGKPPCYEIVREKEHHHFHCKGCQTILHLDSHLLSHLFEPLQAQYLIHECTLELLVMGYCDTCWKSLMQQAPEAPGLV